MWASTEALVLDGVFARDPVGVVSRVSFDAPVRRYIPEFAVQDPAVTGDVAIWHLLTHTPGWLMMPDQGTGRANESARMSEVGELAARTSTTPYGLHMDTRFSGPGAPDP